jgi:RecA-family ATPase
MEARQNTLSVGSGTNHPVIDLTALANDILLNEKKIEQSNSEVTGEQLLNEDDEPIQFLIENLLQRTGLACLAGSSDVGKSTFLRQLAIHITLGYNDFLGFKIFATHNSVIYVSTEDLKSEVKSLLRKQVPNIPPEKLRDLRFIFSKDNLMTTVQNCLNQKPADVIIVDSFSDAYGGDLIDTQKMRAYLHNFQILAEKHKCLILFLHHTGKRTEFKQPNKNNLLSGQGFEAKMRLVLELRADSESPNSRHLCIVKGNYLSSDLKKESRVLHFNEKQLQFTETGDHVPFEQLSSGKGGGDFSKYKQALEYQAQGIIQDEIAKKINYQGKSAVSKLLKKGKINGWDTKVKFGTISEETKNQGEN